MITMPVYIVCRDRFTCLQRLVTWLEGAEGVAEIVLVDALSIYEPLLTYYERTPHRVVRLGHEGGVSATLALARAEGAPYYALTDPDIIPREDCPRDALAYWADCLRVYAGMQRTHDEFGGNGVRVVGPGLELTDLPERYAYKYDTIWGEARAWMRPIDPRVFAASIDSTLHVSAHAPTGTTALRTNYPYVARHWTWYQDLRTLAPDEATYFGRFPVDTFYRDGHAPVYAADTTAWPETSWASAEENEYLRRMYRICAG